MGKFKHKSEPAPQRWHDMQHEMAAVDVKAVWFHDADGKRAVMLGYGGSKMAKLRVDTSVALAVLVKHYPDYKMKRDTGTSIVVDIGEDR